MTCVNRRTVLRQRNPPILMTCVHTGSARLMTCVDRQTVVRALRVPAQRNLLRFTRIHTYFMGCLPGIYSVKRYSRRILGFFCRNSARFSRYFGPQMSQIGVICQTHTQLCDICQQTNGRPCGTVLDWPLAAPAPTPGACRVFYSQMRFIPVACDRSQGEYPARYMAVRAFWRSLGVYGICTEMYGFCTFLYGFARKSGEKRAKSAHESRTGERQAPRCTLAARQGCRPAAARGRRGGGRSWPDDRRQGSGAAGRRIPRRPRFRALGVLSHKVMKPSHASLLQHARVASH